MKRSDKKNQHLFVKALLCVIGITPPTNLTPHSWPNYTAKKVLFHNRKITFTFFFSYWENGLAVWKAEHQNLNDQLCLATFSKRHVWKKIHNFPDQACSATMKESGYFPAFSVNVRRQKNWLNVICTLKNCSSFLKVTIKNKSLFIILLSRQTLMNAMKSWHHVRLLILKDNDDMTQCNAEL